MSYLMLLAVAVLTLFWAPARAEDRPFTNDQPISNVHVRVSSAAVTGLECRLRPFAMEHSRSMGRRYKYFAREAFTRGSDLRPIAAGLFSMIVSLPFLVLSPPVDVLSAPFRRDCVFELQAAGGLTAWAGRPPENAAIDLEGRNATDPGIEDISEPKYSVSRATAAADAQGMFLISIPGRVGRAPNFELSWKVNGLASGAMTLIKQGGFFMLTEPEPEFGSPLEEMEPLEIVPRKK